MKKTARVAACSVLLLLALAQSAAAHVTVQPNEAIAGTFSRFVARVPNESDKESTVKIELELPALAYVSFEPKEGWDRKETTGQFDEPIEAFGQEITEGITKVVWSGGEIGPGEFLEFGFSAKMPDGEGTDLEFGAIQTYSDGEVVKWAGAEDSEHPAPHLKTYDIGAGEGEGQLAVLARLAAESEGAEGGSESEVSEPEDAEPAPQAIADDDEEDESSALPLALSGVAVLLAAAALFVALKKRA